MIPTLEEEIDEYGSDNGVSFSTLYRRDVDSYLDDMHKYLEDKGWSLESIRKNHTNDELVGMYDRIDYKNGLIDVYFYDLFKKLEIKKEVFLGGEGWCDYHVNEDEAFIRYQYGMHETKYGKICIEQGGDLEDFVTTSRGYFREHIDSDLMGNITTIYYNQANSTWFRKLIKDDEKIKKMSEFSVVEEDRYIIFTSEIAKYLNNLELENGGLLSSILEVNEEMISSKISNFLEGLKLEVGFTGNEYIIYSNDMFGDDFLK